jgi:hypothetical protein
VPGVLGGEPMTDDKVAGEGPYGHRCYMQIDPDSCVACSWNEGHARGIREERERCARIADGLLNLEVGDLVGTSIATKIRGGHDEK